MSLLLRGELQSLEPVKIRLLTYPLLKAQWRSRLAGSGMQGVRTDLGSLGHLMIAWVITCLLPAPRAPSSVALRSRARQGCANLSPGPVAVPSKPSTVKGLGEGLP